MSTPLAPNYTYLLVGGPLNHKTVGQQYPITRLEFDYQGQPQPYIKVPVGLFGRTFEVLVHEPLTNQQELAAALANTLLSPDAILAWEKGIPSGPAPAQEVGAGPTRPQDADETYGR